MKISKIKFIAYCGMISLLASLVVGLFGFSISTRNIKNMKNLLLNKQVETNMNLAMKYINLSYGALSQGDGTLLDSDGNSIEGQFGVVDSILEDLGYKSTIFVKVNDDFKRISTNIKSDDKGRAMGTFLGKDHIAYKTLMNGESYIGEAEILGEHYHTNYQPIKDKNGNVIGALFIGIPTKAVDDIIEAHNASMNKINILIIALRAISLSSLIALVSLSVENKKHNSRKNTKTQV